MEKRTILSYVSFLSAILAVAAIIFGLNTRGFSDGDFALPIVISLAAAAALTVLTFLLNWDFLPILANAAYALGFGLTAAKAAPTISDYFNGVSFMGGDLNLCLIYLILTGAALVICSVQLFFPARRAVQA